MVKVMFGGRHGRQLEFVCAAQMEMMGEAQPRLRYAIETVRLNVETQGKAGSRRDYDRAVKKVMNHIYWARLRVDAPSLPENVIPAFDFRQHVCPWEELASSKGQMPALISDHPCFLLRSEPPTHCIHAQQLARTQA